MLYYAIVTLHAIVCFAIIGIVLLHHCRDIPAVESLRHSPHDLHVLLRHRPQYPAGGDVRMFQSESP